MSNTMSPEAQRIAIAEACGWTVINWTLCDPRPEIRNGVETGEIDMNPVADLPDYCSSLDAMHEAEDTLTEEQWIPYLMLLGGKGPTWNQMKRVAHATAAQRAEAFLRTIGKWKEEA